jgi:hypothetical protein
MENPKERIEDILKRNPYLDAKESFFASSGENDWQAIKRLCYFLYRHQNNSWMCMQSLTDNHSYLLYYAPTEPSQTCYIRKIRKSVLKIF